MLCDSDTLLLTCALVIVNLLTFCMIFETADLTIYIFIFHFILELMTMFKEILKASIIVLLLVSLRLLSKLNYVNFTNNKGHCALYMIQLTLYNNWYIFD